MADLHPGMGAARLRPASTRHSFPADGIQIKPGSGLFTSSLSIPPPHHQEEAPIAHITKAEQHPTLCQAHTKGSAPPPAGARGQPLPCRPSCPDLEAPLTLQGSSTCRPWLRPAVHLLLHPLCPPPAQTPPPGTFPAGHRQPSLAAPQGARHRPSVPSP